MGLWLNNDSDNPCQVLFHRIIISMLSFKVVDSHKNPQKANQFINLSLKTWSWSLGQTETQVDEFRLWLRSIFTDKSADVFLPV